MLSHPDFTCDVHIIVTRWLVKRVANQNRIIENLQDHQYHFTEGLKLGSLSKENNNSSHYLKILQVGLMFLRWWRRLAGRVGSVKQDGASYGRKAHSQSRRSDNWIEPVGNELALASQISLMDPSSVVSIRLWFTDPPALMGEEKWPSKSTRMSVSISPYPANLGARALGEKKVLPPPHNCL